MSNHLFRILSSWFQFLSHHAPALTSQERIANGIALGFIGAGHAMYALGTGTEEEIPITRKYAMVRHGFTEFMVVDSRGRHFNVNNSLWYWKWDSVEEWYRIQEGETRRVRMYGWRSPLWGMFPNIVGVMDGPQEPLKIRRFLTTRDASCRAPHGCLAHGSEDHAVF